MYVIYILIKPVASESVLTGQRHYNLNTYRINPVTLWLIPYAWPCNKLHMDNIWPSREIPHKYMGEPRYGYSIIMYTTGHYTHINKPKEDNYPFLVWIINEGLVALRIHCVLRLLMDLLATMWFHAYIYKELNYCGQQYIYTHSSAS